MRKNVVAKELSNRKYHLRIVAARKGKGSYSRKKLGKVKANA
jgi:stalled ribosome alternative rescue factor ArfA